MTTLDAVAGCGRSTFDVRVPVVTRGHVASFGQIITCQSIWACPVCSASKRQERADQTEARARAWLAAGGGLLFVTLTMPHTMADDLPSLLSALSGSWRRVQAQRAYRVTAENLGIVGALRATEITHGYNGWHPHSHVLVWTERPLRRTQVASFEVALYGWWADAVEAEGLRRPSAEHGVRALRVTTGSGALAKYLLKSQDGYDRPAKWSASAEMLRGDLKKGRRSHRTYFQIAEAAVAGDGPARQLVRVYETATKGRRCQEWGRNLARRLKAEGMDPEVVVDVGRVVYEMSNHEWNVLRSTGTGPLAMLAAVELAIEDGRSPQRAAQRVLERAFARYRKRLAASARGARASATPLAG